MEQLPDPVAPRLFIAWAKKNEIEFPTALDASVAALEKKTQGKFPPENQNQNGKDLHPKERETLLKLIIAMAVKAYNYDPSKLCNEAIKRITDHIFKVRLELDEDTVRKWLREASELLPPQVSN